MLKLLLKKQLTEIFRNYFYNPKKNRARSKVGIIGYILLFVIINRGGTGKQKRDPHRVWRNLILGVSVLCAQQSHSMGYSHEDSIRWTG